MQGTDTFNIERFIDSLVSLMLTHEAISDEAGNESEVRSKFDQFLTIFV